MNDNKWDENVSIQLETHHTTFSVVDVRRHSIPYCSRDETINCKPISTYGLIEIYKHCI